MSTRTLTFSGADLRTKALAVDDDKLVVDAVTGEVTTGRRLHVSNGFTITQGSNIITELPKHDRPLVKYPEVVLTSTSDKGYVINRSSANSSFPVTNLFNDSLTDRWLSTVVEGDIWSGTTYIGSNYITDINGTQHPGAWIRLKMPKQIKLSYVVQRDNSSSPPASRVPAEVKILGTNDSTNFYLLKTFTGLSNVSLTTTLFVNEAQPYNEYAYVMKDTVAPEGGIDLSSLEFWGTEEGDESVDIVHKSIPNKPGQQQLAVYWDANDTSSYSGSGSTTVTDLSGNGVTGTLNGVGYDAVDNAFTFDGVNDYVESSITTLSGDQIHSISFWLKLTNSQIGSVRQDPFLIGNTSNAADKLSGMLIQSDNIYWYFSGNDIIIPSSSLSLIGKKWYNITLVYTGGGGTIANRKIYIDGLAYNGTITYGGLGYGNILAFDSSTSKIRIGKSTAYPFNGSIANFRVYGKALNADQVRELYDYDAERFGHRQNLVALHKGNLGVGVTNPTSRFEVAGADGLQEYPPKAMTGYETYIEGHGVFKTRTSPGHTVNFPPWRAFDAETSETVWYTGYANGAPSYNGVDGLYSNTIQLSSTTVLGEYLILELPYRIFPHKVSYLRQGGGEHLITAAKFYGRNGDYGEWVEIGELTSAPTSDSVPGSYSLDSTKAYDQLAIVATKRYAASSTLGVSIRTLTYYGTPAPSSLEDGHLTLGKALTLPRVSGHPAGAETPRAASLVVHYDTTVDSVVSGTTVVDISGEGVNGTLNGAAYSSTDRAFTFDGVDDYVSGTLNNPAGAWVHTVSMWFKHSGTNTDNIIFVGGVGSTNQSFGIQFLTTGTKRIRYFFYSNDVDYNFTVNENTWLHITTTYNGSSVASGRKVYINGTELSQTGTNGTIAALSVPANASFRIGTNLGTTNDFDGSISNFKLWNVALTAEEVAAEYALGRTGKSINLTDTALCIGGTVPRAQLDVRGVARCEGMYSGNTTLKFYRLSGSFAADNVNNFSVSAPVGFTKGDTIVQLTGCTKSSNGDVIPWHNDDANWKTSLYYDYTNNVIAVYSIGLTNQAKTYEILIVTI